MIRKIACLFLLPLLFLETSIVAGQSMLQFDQVSLHSRYVDSVYHRLSRKKRISQLFIVPVYSNKNEVFQDSMSQLIEKYQPGGLLFFQGGPVRQALLENHFQSLLEVKALVAMDAEWGLGMRLDSTISFPYQMALGAIRDNALIQLMGSQIGRDFKRLGMQLNFAPDIDINNNPDNPVIGFRSFGENRENVAGKGLAFMRGLQEHHVIAVAKHFPGHGDTNVDSHMDLPVIGITLHRLDSLELFPFRRLTGAGLGAVMSAHIHVPSLDTTRGLPVTLSAKAINGLLRRDMHFSGLVITDAMNMLGIAKHFDPAQAAVGAFEAGNDMVEMSPDLPAAIKGVRKAIRHGKLDRADIELKCRKVILAKYWAGLNFYHQVDTTHLIRDLNQRLSYELAQQLSDSSLTMLRGQGKWIRAGLESGKSAVLCVGSKIPGLVADTLKRHYNLPAFSLGKNASQRQIDSVAKLLRGASRIFLLVYDTRLRPRSKLDFAPELLAYISSVAQVQTTVSCFFCNAYALRDIRDIDKSTSLFLCYQDSPFAETSFVKYLKGNIPAGGRLPVSIGNNLPFGTGMGQSK